MHFYESYSIEDMVNFDISRGATAGKAPQGLGLPRFWVSIRSYKKQPVKKNWGRVLGLAKLKFAVARHGAPD